MKLLTLTLITVFTLGLASFAQAEDGFGSPFMNQAPSALSDTGFGSQGLAAAQSVADIEPAAGGDDMQEVPASQEDIPAVSEGESLEGIQKEIQGALSP